jgi:hypothetical protein
LVITSMPFSTTVSLSPFIVTSNVFHSPMLRSAFRFGVTPARTSGGIFASVRYPYTSPDPHGHAQMFTCALLAPRK